MYPTLLPCRLGTTPMYFPLFSKCGIMHCSITDARWEQSLFWEQQVLQTCRKCNWVSGDEEAHSVCPVCHSLRWPGLFMDFSVLVLWEISSHWGLWLVSCRRDKMGSYKRTKQAGTQMCPPLPSTPRLDQYFLCMNLRTICKVKKRSYLLSYSTWGR